MKTIYIFKKGSHVLIPNWDQSNPESATKAIQELTKAGWSPSTLSQSEIIALHINFCAAVAEQSKGQ